MNKFKNKKTEKNLFRKQNKTYQSRINKIYNINHCFMKSNYSNLVPYIQGLIHHMKYLQDKINANSELFSNS